MNLEQVKNALLFAKISGLTPCIATEGDSEQLMFTCDSDAKIEEILKNPGLAEIVLELCERTPIETVKQALSWLDREWSRAQQFDGDTAELARLTAENLEEASRNINLLGIYGLRNAEFMALLVRFIASEIQKCV